MPNVYRERDANPAALEGSRIAVLGYGNLGRALAWNLRDHGLNIVVGNREDDYAFQARVDGFPIMGLTAAAQTADIKLLLLADELLPEVYLNHVAPSLKPGNTLLFASGFNVAFGFVEPPPFVDVVLLAPRSIGSATREAYLAGRGFLSFVAVGQDSSGKAWERLLALALASGSLRAGALESTFEQEAELHLFVQQAFLPALQALMLTAADLLIKEGYPPDAALLDLYISGEIGYSLNKAAELGMNDSLKLYSLAGQYGMLSRSDRFQEPKLRRQMEIILEDIRTGKFAQEWASEYGNGYPKLEALWRKREQMPLWALEQQVLQLLRSFPPESR